MPPRKADTEKETKSQLELARELARNPEDFSRNRSRRFPIFPERNGMLEPLIGPA